MRNVDIKYYYYYYYHYYYYHYYHYHHHHHHHHYYYYYYYTYGKGGHKDFEEFVCCVTQQKFLQQSLIYKSFCLYRWNA